MSQEETYNGWKNYPTWCVNLWLSNDEGLYHRTLETIAGARESFEDSDERTEGREFRGYLADWLKDYLNEDLFSEAFSPEPEYNGPARVADDLAQWALAHVDWYELADAWLEVEAEQVS